MLAGERRAAAASQQPETLIQPKRDLLGGQRLDSRRCELQRQWNAVESTTYLHHSRCVASRQREPRLRSDGALHEQLHRRTGQELLQCRVGIRPWHDK